MIIDEDDQKDILNEVYEELGLTIKFMKFEDVLKAIGLYKLNPNYLLFLNISELQHNQITVYIT